MRALTRLLDAEHKLIAGPRTLLWFAGLLVLLLLLLQGEPISLREALLRAALGSAAILGVLVWAERDRPLRR
ncbi:MAG: hypothetical protein ACXVFV_12145 [Mycobacteriales bacterium]